MGDEEGTSNGGRPPSSATAPPKGLGMQLDKSQRTNQFLESLKAEGEFDCSWQVLWSCILDEVNFSSSPDGCWHCRSQSDSFQLAEPSAFTAFLKLL
nr:coatomer subunit delta-1 [Quercus suber]